MIYLQVFNLIIFTTKQLLLPTFNFSDKNFITGYIINLLTASG